MKISSEKLLVRGKKLRKILSITGIKKYKDLPYQYLKEGPYIFERDNSIFWKNENGSENVCTPASVPKIGITFASEFTEENFQCFLQSIKKSIKKLSKVNASLPRWEGEETFIF